MKTTLAIASIFALIGFVTIALIAHEVIKSSPLNWSICAGGYFFGILLFFIGVRKY